VFLDVVNTNGDIGWHYFVFYVIEFIICVAVGHSGITTLWW